MDFNVPGKTIDSRAVQLLNERDSIDVNDEGIVTFDSLLHP